VIKFHKFSLANEMSEIKKSKLYTRTGDSGTTSLFNNQRKPKDDIIFECLGTLDELGAHLGLAREYCQQTKNGLADHIAQVQL
jgi:cob(I)alamin adenosyltransferase